MDRTTIRAPRRTRRALLPALAGLAMLPGMTNIGASAKKKKKPKKPKPGKTRIVRQTFTSSALIEIPERGRVPDFPVTIPVTGFKRGRVRDVDVVLDGITHGDLSDLDLVLEAPDGRRAIVLSDAGTQYGTNQLTLRLDDQAVDVLPEDSRFGSGAYQPVNHPGFDPGDPDLAAVPGPGPVTSVRLSTFNGINPNGLWRLWIVDDQDRNAGQIERGWALVITATVRR